MTEAEDLAKTLHENEKDFNEDEFESWANKLEVNATCNIEDPENCESCSG